MTMSQDALIGAAVRTPIGRRSGNLSDWRPDDLLALILRAVLERARVAPEAVDQVIVGCVDQAGEQSFNIARRGALIAGFPFEVPGATVDLQCGSGQQAVHIAANAIRAGDADVVIAAGVESMTRVPLAGAAHIYGSPVSQSYIARYEWTEQGIASEMMAKRFSLARRELDEFALESHRRAAHATEKGFFRREIVPVPSATDAKLAPFDIDEGIRLDTSLEKLATLKPAFLEGGVTTAGNASQISDGAAAVLLMSAAAAERLGVSPMARLVAQTTVGVDPVLMLHGPIAATRRVLERASLSMAEIDLFEVNEAFATVALAWLRETGADWARLNVNGGAIALGHPLGATGARILTTLVHEMVRRGDRFGLQAICAFGGMATAAVVERLPA